MGAHGLLNLLNKLVKSYKMCGLSIFHNKFSKFNNSGVRMLD